MPQNAADPAARKRERRLEEGRRAREAEKSTFAAGGRRVPTHKQLLLPLLEAIRDRGGSVRPSDIYDELADRVGVDSDVCEETRTFRDGQSANLWKRHVRWARQTAVEEGLIADGKRGIWELTDGGANMLRNVRHGVILTVFETEDGTCLWATAETAAAAIEPGSVDLLLTSPMFPTVTDKRGYGTMDPASWLDWMTDMGHAWKDLLTDTGSMFIHLGDVWYRGTPTLSPYIERFVIRMLDDVGLHLAEKFFAEHPTRLPAPRPWVAMRRMRVKPSVDPIYWFSKNEFCKADNRRVLVPYSDSTRKNWIGKHDAGGRTGPSGHDIGRGSFAQDNGGAIPGNLIRCLGQDADVKRYRKAAKAAGFPVHPAIMPREMAEMGVKLATEPGDLVYDPFFGSGTTGHVAEALGRRWLGSERSLDYAQSAALRFPDATLLSGGRA